MKTNILSAIAIALFTCLFTSAGFAQQTTSTTATSTGTTYSLTVIVSNVNNRTGKLYVGLSNSPTNFNSDSFKRKTVDVPASGEIPIVFDGLPAGKYAVRLFQDLNNNQKMDFEGQMPSEPFGLSNVTMMMGPPDFDQSSFDLNENKSISIKMLSM